MKRPVITETTTSTDRQAAGPRCLRALVVDDEPVMVNLAGNMLRILGFQVDAAYGGQEALDLVQENRYDLVLTDLMMPRVNGFDLAQGVGQHSQNTRVVMMTGCRPVDVGEMLHSEWIDHWLFKPFTVFQLKEAIETLFPAESLQGLGTMAVSVRPEMPGDIGAVRQIYTEAFKHSAEADLIDAVRQGDGGAISLVAVEGARVVGHILFAPVIVAAEGRRKVQGMGLSPMAVRPQCQRRGIGSMLVRSGIDQLRREGCPYIVVLGPPDYYVRFGFEQASLYGLSCQCQKFAVEWFKVLVLNKKEIRNITGAVQYPAEFISFQ